MLLLWPTWLNVEQTLLTEKGNLIQSRIYNQVFKHGNGNGQLPNGVKYVFRWASMVKATYIRRIYGWWDQMKSNTGFIRVTLPKMPYRQLNIILMKLFDKPNKWKKKKTEENLIIFILVGQYYFSNIKKRVLRQVVKLFMCMLLSYWCGYQKKENYDNEHGTWNIEHCALNMIRFGENRTAW